MVDSTWCALGAGSFVRRCGCYVKHTIAMVRFVGVVETWKSHKSNCMDIVRLRIGIYRSLNRRPGGPGNPHRGRTKGTAAPEAIPATGHISHSAERQKQWLVRSTRSGHLASRVGWERLQRSLQPGKEVGHESLYGTIGFMAAVPTRSATISTNVVNLFERILDQSQHELSKVCSNLIILSSVLRVASATLLIYTKPGKTPSRD